MGKLINKKNAIIIFTILILFFLKDGFMQSNLKEHNIILVTSNEIKKEKFFIGNPPKLRKVSPENVVYTSISGFESKDLSHATDKDYFYIKIVMMGHIYPFPTLQLSKEIYNTYHLSIVDRVHSNASLVEKHGGATLFNVVTLKTSKELTQKDKTNILTKLIAVPNPTYSDPNIAVYGIVNEK